MGRNHTAQAKYEARIRAEQAKLHELKIKAEAEQLKKQNRKDKIITTAITVPLVAAAMGFAAWDVKHTDWQARNHAIAASERAKAEATLQTIADCPECQIEATDRATLRHQEHHTRQKNQAEWVLRQYATTASPDRER